MVYKLSEKSLKLTHVLNFVLFSIILNSCSTDVDTTSDCMCTERECSTNINPAFSLTLDISEHSQYTVDDFQEVVIIQADLSANPIDSINAEFVSEAFGSDQLKLTIGDEYTSFSIEFSESIVIIKNKGINQLDTLSNFKYSFTENEEVCNSCSGGPNCNDQTYIVRSFSSLSAFYNSQPITDFETPYLIK